jgi:hypothetical protein
LSNSVGAPIFTAMTAKGVKPYGLFELFAAASQNSLIELSGMAAHQRAPVVTVLAIIMHVLTRYADVDRDSESSWAEAWDKLIGPDALRLTAPHDEVAFLQPPTGEPTSQQAIEGADLLPSNVEHEVKRTWSTPRADQAIFSLIGSLPRPNVKDHRSSTRTGLCAVLPSDPQQKRASRTLGLVWEKSFPLSLIPHQREYVNAVALQHDSRAAL